MHIFEEEREIVLEYITGLHSYNEKKLALIHIQNFHEARTKAMYLELLEAMWRHIKTYTSIAESSNESAKCDPQKNVLSKEKQKQKLTNIIQKPRSVDGGNHPHRACGHHK